MRQIARTFLKWPRDKPTIHVHEIAGVPAEVRDRHFPNTSQWLWSVSHLTLNASNITTLFFDVLLTVHLSIFILVINQFDAQNLFYNKFISCLYMFRAPCAHRQEVKIVLYSLWYYHTYRWPCRAQVERGLCMGRPPIGVMIPEAV